MTVTGGSALGKDEINDMVKEAEAHAEEDRQRREAVDTKNEAEALVFRTEKLLAENGDKTGEDTKAPVDEALAELKTALEGDDTEAIKASMEKLNTTSAAMGQAMYAAAQAEAQEQAAAGGEGAAPTEDPAAAEDDVVDAEIVDDENNEGDSK